MKRTLTSTLLFGLILVPAAMGQVYLPSTDDANTSNDVSRGPSSTNDRSDFVEIRNFDNGEDQNRRRIGYFKFDISGIDPLLLPYATLSGTFANSRDGNGEYNVYGLNDGLLNTDDDPSFTEQNWTEGGLSYSRGLGVDTSEPSGVGNSLGIDLSETALLGTITLVGGEPLQSNTTDLDLSSFLAADSNGVVTFMVADERINTETELPVGTEWRVTARERSVEGSMRLAFIPLEGDTNLDGVVTQEDLLPIRTNFGVDDLAYTDGDLNGDGQINSADFRSWKNGFLAGGGQISEAIAWTPIGVPEPSSAFLLVALASVLPGRRR